VTEQLSYAARRSLSDIASQFDKAHLIGRFLFSSRTEDRPVVTSLLSPHTSAFRLPWRPLATFCLTAAIAVAGATGASAQSLDSALRNKDLAVIVEVDGSLPGFSKDELSAYICQQMAAAHATSWHFVPTSIAPTGGDQPSNRIVWKFKQLPFAGGGVRYLGPALSKTREVFGVGRAISIDAKIFLNDEFEATTFDEATVKGGPSDPSLAAVIQKVMKSIVTNAFAYASPDGLMPARLSTTRSG
jgi:hypothetical protein